MIVVVFWWCWRFRVVCVSAFSSYSSDVSLELPLLSLMERKILQKKKTQFKYKTRKIGGTNAIFTTVAGTHNFPANKRDRTKKKKM